MVIRPDMASSVNKVSQFMHCPLDTHLKVVKRIFRYLKGTSTYRMTIKRPLYLSLVGYSDANWGNDLDDRRSMTRYCVFFDCNVIALSSKKQHTVSLSTTKTEYRSLANAKSKLFGSNCSFKN